MTGAARRRRERRLRAHLRYARMSVAMPLAECQHHNAQRPKTARAWEEEREVHYTSAFCTTVPPSELELFDLFDEPGGGGPTCRWSRRGHSRGFTGTPRCTPWTSCRTCRFSMCRCRRWRIRWWKCCRRSTWRLWLTLSRSSPCPRYLLTGSHSVLRYVVRRRQNADGVVLCRAPAAHCRVDQHSSSSSLSGRSSRFSPRIQQRTVEQIVQIPGPAGGGPHLPDLGASSSYAVSRGESGHGDLRTFAMDVRSACSAASSSARVHPHLSSWTLGLCGRGAGVPGLGVRVPRLPRRLMGDTMDPVSDGRSVLSRCLRLWPMHALPARRNLDLCELQVDGPPHDDGDEG